MIVKYPNDVLHQECKEVKRLDDKVIEVIDKLKSNLNDASNGIGLAASQIGENLSIFAIQHPGHNHIHLYINPKIIDTFNKKKVYPQVYTQEGDREEFYEGCLSFPGIYGSIKRWMEIQVRYQTLVNDKLETREETIEGLMAIVFQHELDHLKGILFVDHIKEEKGSIFKEDEGELKAIDIGKVIKNK